MFGLERRSGALCALGTLALFGCDDSSGGTELAPPPTMIVVDPEQFDGAVSCVDAPGGMRLYVATLFDVAQDYDAAVPELPSSPPTRCTTQVGFGYVEPGRKYRAEIDGYDLDDLEPLTDGNRLLRHRDTGDLVAPRWRASCGNPLPEGSGSGDGGDLSFLEGPAEAFLNASVTVMGCTPFSDSNTMPLGAAIRVDLSRALGELRCGSAQGQIARYEVSIRDSMAAPSAASCGTTVTFDNLTANQTYFFDVLAFEGSPAVAGGLADASTVDSGLGDATASDGGSLEAGSATPGNDAGGPSGARWRTSCYQQALMGVQQTAICEPLAPTP